MGDNDLNQSYDFCYKISCNYQVSSEYLMSEHELIKKISRKRPIERILELIRDNKNRKGELIKYLIKNGELFLMKHKIREALLILFELDSRTDDEFETIETMTTPKEYLDSLTGQTEIYKEIFKGML